MQLVFHDYVTVLCVTSELIKVIKEILLLKLIINITNYR